VLHAEPSVMMVTDELAGVGLIRGCRLVVATVIFCGVMALSCPTGRVGRLAQLQRPIRVVCAVLAVALVVLSFTLPDGSGGSAVTVAGCAVLVVVVLLPVVTDFEIDVLGMRAKASLSTRQRELQDICEGVSPRVGSLLHLVGVEPLQIPAIVQEAVQDSSRLWRGRVVPAVVTQLVVCRAARLVQLSLMLGGPYRVRELDRDAPAEPAWNAFAGLKPLQRLIVGLIIWTEFSEGQVATMLDIDAQSVAAAMREWSAGETTGVTG
jgi:hypothetical protein